MDRGEKCAAGNLYKSKTRFRERHGQAGDDGMKSRSPTEYRSPSGSLGASAPNSWGTDAKEKGFQKFRWLDWRIANGAHAPDGTPNRHVGTLVLAGTEMEEICPEVRWLVSRLYRLPFRMQATRRSIAGNCGPGTGRSNCFEISHVHAFPK